MTMPKKAKALYSIATGIISVVLGAVLIEETRNQSLAIYIAAGAGLIIYGVILLVLSLRKQRDKKEVRKSGNLLINKNSNKLFFASRIISVVTSLLSLIIFALSISSRYDEVAGVLFFIFILNFSLSIILFAIKTDKNKIT